MNLFNKKILQEYIQKFQFPTGAREYGINAVLEGLVNSFLLSNLEKTKETSVQSLFLQRVFEEVLGYDSQLKGKEEWNLTVEPKTEVDSTEADGSLGFFCSDKAKNRTKAVIELKDAKTSLDKKQSGRVEGYTPVEQAFGYSNKFDGCQWVIVSNYKEIRLYNRMRGQGYYELFEVQKLKDPNEFKRFYFCLCKENFINTHGEAVIDVLAKETSKNEDEITKKFYKHYKELRLKLYDHLISHNPEVKKDIVLEKSQKILDRLTFALFCEDTSNLLPRDIVKKTYDYGIKSRDRSDERVWREFRNLFMDIDEGRTDIDPKVNKYNGGLFAKDDVLDTMHIKDDIWNDLIKLADYDFNTDLNVNILGHIFEQSLSDLETIKAEINGEIVDKTTSKRKKDGIYYTPEYITRYIVENTVGTLLQENPEKLETIKILDPACGSGAFLNQAHSYLREQWKLGYEEGRIKSKEADEFGGMRGTLWDYNPAENDRAILLNNIFGVDLNKESVELTKLALWLKTAKPSEPLQNLDKNVKCGNSLISDFSVAGDFAFSWEKEYSNIIQGGGFDVVIGNPPYVDSEQMVKSDPTGRDFISSKFDSAKGNWDLYVPFIEQGLRLLNEGGYLGFIIPNKVLGADYAQSLRNIVKQGYALEQIIDLSKEKVFEGINVYPVILIIRKTTFSKVIKTGSNLIGYTFNKIKTDNLDDNWSIYIDKHYSEVHKILASGYRVLGDIAKISASATVSEAYAIQTQITDSPDPDKSKYFLLINTGTIDKFTPLWGVKDFTYIKEKYLNPLLVKEAVTNKQWISKPKLIVNGMGTQIECFYDFSLEYLPTKSTNVIYDSELPLEFIGAILNSEIMSVVFTAQNSSVGMAGGYMNINQNNLSKLPIPSADKDVIEKISALFRNISTETRRYELLNKSSKEFLTSETGLLVRKDISDIDWNVLSKELGKTNQKLDVVKREELFKWFKERQGTLIESKRKIDEQTDLLNKEVFSLYNVII